MTGPSFSRARLALVNAEDGNVPMATTLLSAMVRLKGNPDETIGWVLLNLACELVRRALIAMR